MLLQYCIAMDCQGSLLRCVCCLLHCAGDDRDSRLLVKLREQREAQLEELKDLTNFYKTQEIIKVRD